MAIGIFSKMEEEFEKAATLSELRAVLDKYCESFIFCGYAELLYQKRKREIIEEQWG